MLRKCVTQAQAPGATCVLALLTCRYYIGRIYSVRMLRTTTSTTHTQATLLCDSLYSMVADIRSQCVEPARRLQTSHTNVYTTYFCTHDFKTMFASIKIEPNTK